MNRFTSTLIALCVGGAAVAAPTAFADSYYYGGGDRYDRHEARCDVRHHKGKGYGHDRHRGHAPRRVIHHHVYHEPVRERVIIERAPRRHRSDYGYHQEYRSATPMIMGGIVGGVLGNQVGKGSGRDAATVAGVLLGGSIGRDIGHRR